MADRVGAYYDNGRPAWWVEAGSNKPYTIDQNPFSSRYGKKTYLPPRAIDPYGPSGAPAGGFLHGAGEWNSDTGQFDQHLNGGNLLSLGVGATMAAPFLAGAFGAGG